MMTALQLLSHLQHLCLYTRYQGDVMFTVMRHVKKQNNQNNFIVSHLHLSCTYFKDVS